MSRTNKGSKGPGYDYWSRRYGNGSGMNCPSTKQGKHNSENTKRITNRAERRIAKNSIDRSMD